MGRVLDSFIASYERFLRFDTLANATNILRARAVYLIGLSFIVTQFVNIFMMTMTYGGWTLDHTVSIVASVLVFLLVNSMRYQKNFVFIAIAYSLLLFVGISSSALIDGMTGVNSALIPLLIAGSVLNGFIGGWRMVSVFFIASIAFIWCLYSVSLNWPIADQMSREAYEARIFQRAFQSSLALTLISIFSGFITSAIHRLFVQLEDLVEQVKQSDKEKTEFLANMSHELRTPLNGVNGISQLLMSSDMPNPKHKDYITMINRCGKRLTQIVGNALELSKLDAGKFELDTAPFDLRKTIEQLGSRYQPVAQAKGINLSVSYTGSLPSNFVGDERRVRQIVKNLLSNAIKFTDQGSVSIDVSGSLRGRDKADVIITVSDSGIGIKRENIDKVFRRFEQVERGLTRSNDGTGLGLAISNEFVSFMGGKIDVESRPGVGSSFKVNLTLVVASEAGSPLSDDSLKSAA